MMQDLLGAFLDALRGLGTLMALGAGACLAFLVASCVYTWIHERRTRCRLCQQAAAVRYRTRHGQVCEPCQAMLSHRALGIPARGT